jgi:hypothetical protein
LLILSCRLKIFSWSCHYTQPWSLGRFFPILEEFVWWVRNFLCILQFFHSWKWSNQSLDAWEVRRHRQRNYS